MAEPTDKKDEASADASGAQIGVRETIIIREKKEGSLCLTLFTYESRERQEYRAYVRLTLHDSSVHFAEISDHTLRSASDKCAEDPSRIIQMFKSWELHVMRSLKSYIIICFNAPTGELVTFSLVPAKDPEVARIKELECEVAHTREILAAERASIQQLMDANADLARKNGELAAELEQTKSDLLAGLLQKTTDLSHKCPRIS